MLVELLSQLNEARAAVGDFAKTDGRAALHELLLPLFNSPITTLRWYHYPPRNNDGDPMDFSVSEIGFSVLDDPEDEEDYHEWPSLLSLHEYLEPYENSKYANNMNPYFVNNRERLRAEHEQNRQEMVEQGFTPEVEARIKEALRSAEVVFTSHAGWEFLEDLFGNWATVTVTSDGIDSDGDGPTYW